MKPAEARAVVMANAKPLKALRLPLGEALGLSLAESLRARADLPRMDVSAMDGYAVKGSPDGPLPLGPPIAAGSPRSSLRAGQARPIYTGAPLPLGADRVIPRELAEPHGHSIGFTHGLGSGANIRRRGEELRKGALGLRAGQVLLPTRIGFAAMLGHGDVLVRPAPRVRLLVTGDELRPAGAELSSGQIWDSNGPLASAWLAARGIQAKPQGVPDHEATLSHALQAALGECQVLITCGGASVGDKDLLRPVLAQLGAKTLLWRVDQKPGGPLYVGRTKKTLIFGLPGNPAAVAFCLSHYVAPALDQMQGIAPALCRLLPCGEALENRGSKTHFLKARIAAGKARSLGAQGSHMLSSLADADGWLELPPGGLRGGEAARLWPL